MTAQHLVDVHVLFLRDGEILLSKRRSPDEFDGRWHLPAGKLESGESATVAAAREAMEEVGVTLHPAELRLIHVSHVVDAHRPARLGLFFEIRRWSGDPVNREPDKCYELRWFSLAALPDDIIAYSLEGIRAHSTGAPYSELGWGERSR
ncbi:NUDIX domain-containing protein [Nocardia sp. NPDC005366]|uniref:NUDIX hydrolase n=1 Tax=Nocardia sp. NPDC005366 TaxID=3156878 RepID=UPI0033A5E824